MSMSSELSALPESNVPSPQNEEPFFHFEYDADYFSVGTNTDLANEPNTPSNSDDISCKNNSSSEPSTPFDGIPIESAGSQPILFHVDPLAPLEPVDSVYYQDEDTLTLKCYPVESLYDSEEQFPIYRGNMSPVAQEVIAIDKVEETPDINKDLLRHFEMSYERTFQTQQIQIQSGLQSQPQPIQQLANNDSIYRVLDPRLIEITALSKDQVNGQLQTFTSVYGYDEPHNYYVAPQAAINTNYDLLNHEYQFVTPTSDPGDELGINYNALKESFIIKDFYDSSKQESTKTVKRGRKVLKEVNGTDVIGDFKCKHQRCDGAFKRKSDYRRHLKTHIVLTFKCPYYDALENHKGKDTFNRMDVWKRHLRTFHFVFLEGDDSNQGLGNCKACGEFFSAFNQFADKHIEICAKQLKLAHH